MINKNDNFIDILYCLLLKQDVISFESGQLFNKLLVALHAGFGIVTPTVILPRFSASTKADMRMNIIAGFTGAGKAHVGACSHAMKLLDNLICMHRNERVEVIKDKLDLGEKIPGFGHPPGKDHETHCYD